MGNHGGIRTPDPGLVSSPLRNKDWSWTYTFPRWRMKTQLSQCLSMKKSHHCYSLLAWLAALDISGKACTPAYWHYIWRNALFVGRSVMPGVLKQGAEWWMMDWTLNKLRNVNVSISVSYSRAVFHCCIRTAWNLTHLFMWRNMIWWEDIKNLNQTCKLFHHILKKLDLTIFYSLNIFTCYW